MPLKKQEKQRNETVKKLEMFVILIIVIVALTGCNNKASAEVVSVEHDPMENGSWGVTLTAKNVTPVGMTIVCTQDGYEVAGELFTGSSYSLYRYVEEEWEKVEYLPQEHEIAWTSEAWIIQQENTTKWDVNWEWLYGKLPVGKYRIGKSITDFRESGDYDTATYFVEFEIEK